MEVVPGMDRAYGGCCEFPIPDRTVESLYIAGLSIDPGSCPCAASDPATTAGVPVDSLSIRINQDPHALSRSFCGVPVRYFPGYGFSRWGLG